MTLNKKKKLIFLDEFSPKSSSPNAIVMNSFVENFKDDFSIQQIFFSAKHAPGGLKPKRLLNILMMFFFTPLYLFYAKFRYDKPIVFVSTSPPGFHLIVPLINSFLGLKTIVWLFDAHPEIECLIFDKWHLTWISFLLRRFEQLCLNRAEKIIVLDEAMQNRLLPVLKDATYKIEVCPPWSTYIHPSKPFLAKSIPTDIRFLYAGNYGQIHCLQEFQKQIAQFSETDQRKIHLDFIGINDDGKKRIEELFAQTHCLLKFLPRKPSVLDVVQLFPEYHFGLVSLNAKYNGLGCPSKSLTYVSQGLPIYYVGPGNSLSEMICTEGYGIAHTSVNTLDFQTWKAALSSFLSALPNNTYSDKKNISLLKMKLMVEN